MSDAPELTPGELRRRLAADPPRSRRRTVDLGRLRVAAAFAIPVTAALVGGFLVLSTPSAPQHHAAAPATAPPTTARTTTSTLLTSTTSTIACRLTVPEPSADVDGDGCPDPLKLSDGVVETPAGRYAVGQPGDKIAVGDWDCDGTATAASLRPSTGEVWTFDRWPGPDVELEGTLVGVAKGATDLLGLDLDADGCDDIVVATPEGRRPLTAAPSP